MPWGGPAVGGELSREFAVVNVDQDLMPKSQELGPMARAPAFPFLDPKRQRTPLPRHHSDRERTVYYYEAKMMSRRNLTAEQECIRVLTDAEAFAVRARAVTPIALAIARVASIALLVACFLATGNATELRPFVGKALRLAGSQHLAQPPP